MNRSTDLYVDGKRHILVADDEMVNREMLENILSDEYDVLLAEDGERAYDLIRQNRNTLFAERMPIHALLHYLRDIIQISRQVV